MVKEHLSDLLAQKLLTARRPLIIGHRGYCALAPENTLPSFQMALDAKADLVELDYHHSQDGMPMVIHNPTLDDTTDARKKWKLRRIAVADHPAAEIQTLDAGSWFDRKFADTKVPLLTEALDCICGHGTVALIEHKSGDAATCVRILRERNLIHHVVVISFDWPFLREFHELEPDAVLGALGPATIRLADGRKPARMSKPLSASWLDHLAATGARLTVWNRQVSKPAVDLAHQRGLKVWVYTVNDGGLARRLVAAGVDGIITNDVRLIRNALSSR